MYWFFVLKKDKIKLGSFATLSFKGNDQYKILMLLYAPFLVFYGFLLIPLGASYVKRIGGDRVCLYSSDVFKWIDILFFAGTMIMMSLLTFACRHVEDDMGENLALQKYVCIPHCHRVTKHQKHVHSNTGQSVSPWHVLRHVPLSICCVLTVCVLDALSYRYRLR